MYEYVWKMLVWPSTTLVSSLTGFDAYHWLSDDPPDRLLTGIVCGFVAGVVWLMLISTMRIMAER